MAVQWCGAGVAVVWRWCGGSVVVVWRCNVWRWCGGGVAVVWWQCGGGVAVAVVWWWCGGDVAVQWCGGGEAVGWFVRHGTWGMLVWCGFWWLRFVGRLGSAVWRHGVVWSGDYGLRIFYPYIFNVGRANADALRGSMKYQLTCLNMRLFKCGYRREIYHTVHGCYGIGHNCKRSHLWGAKFGSFLLQGPDLPIP